MLHHSPIHHLSPHHQLYTAVSPCSSSHSPTATDEPPPPPGSYESAEESGCEGHEALEEELEEYADSYDCYRNCRDHLSISPPTPPITRQRSHTYCGQEFPRLPFLTTDIVERCHSNDALWMRVNERHSSAHFTNSGELYETRSSISSTSTSRRKSLSRCLAEEDQDMTGCTGLRRVLSSLSLRLLQGEKERPVQRILRPPRRRQTMRGLSGLPIESVNQWNSAASISG